MTAGASGKTVRPADKDHVLLSAVVDRCCMSKKRTNSRSIFGDTDLFSYVIFIFVFGLTNVPVTNRLTFKEKSIYKNINIIYITIIYI